MQYIIPFMRVIIRFVSNLGMAIFVISSILTVCKIIISVLGFYTTFDVGKVYISGIIFSFIIVKKFYQELFPDNEQQGQNVQG